MTRQEYQKLVKSIVIPANMPAEKQDEMCQPIVDFLKTNTPKDLFRFRSCKERTIDEFDQDLFCFSPAYKMNDDFDGLLYFDKELIRTSLIDTLSVEKVCNAFEQLREGAIPSQIPQAASEFLSRMSGSIPSFTPETINALICKFIGYVTNDYDQRMHIVSGLTQNQKIVSLSETINSPAMWGYYADDGRGFALSYDLRELNFSEYFLSPVVYSDERLNATVYATWLLQQQVLISLSMDINIPNFYELLQNLIPCPDNFMAAKAMIHKATDWSHEKEWRLIYHEKTRPYTEHPRIIKRPTAIYLGRKISAIHEKILRRIAKERNIPVFKMTINANDSAYKLFPELIE